MPNIDRNAPLRFLSAAYQKDDWVAVFLKSYATRRTTQRVGPVSLFASVRLQAWLRAQNEAGYNVYISVNAIKEGHLSRRRDDIGAIRHVFLDADHDAARVLAAIDGRRDLAPPSYVVHSSANRVHILWQASGFTLQGVDALQRQLARELGTDTAATSCSQMARLPGFVNHKHTPPQLVTVEYRCLDRWYTPHDFPMVAASPMPEPVASPFVAQDGAERARRYLAATPPAVAGQHGDVHTFRVCCRLVRGFALAEIDALKLLVDWNAACQPPWSEHELRAKLRHAIQYGREPVGGLLETQP